MFNHVVAQHAGHMIVDEQDCNWLINAPNLFRYAVELLLDLLKHGLAISAENCLVLLNIERMKIRRKNHEVDCLIVSYEDLLEVWPSFN